MILAGEVTVNGCRVDKSGTNVNEDANLVVTSSKPRYVSRGGFKLEHAIAAFRVDFSGKTVLDVGASTGGYTDCALQHGAIKVYALDVGYGQLHWSLRNDPRVVNIERTNIRYYEAAQLGEQVDIAVVDVSFISTALVFPVVKSMIKEQGKVISLIKPQFEAGKHKVGKKGVVREPAVHREVLLNSIDNARRNGLYCSDVTYSPIKGPKGNIEYFILLSSHEEEHLDWPHRVDEIVAQAHRNLGGN